MTTVYVVTGTYKFFLRLQSRTFGVFDSPEKAKKYVWMALKQFYIDLDPKYSINIHDEIREISNEEVKEFKEKMGNPGSFSEFEFYYEEEFPDPVSQEPNYFSFSFTNKNQELILFIHKLEIQ